MPTRLPLIALPVLALAFDPPPALPGSAVALRCAPEAGLALRKHFHHTGTMEVRGVSRTVDGEEREDDTYQSSETETTLVFVDRYIDRDDERALVLEREYERFESENLIEFEFDTQTREMSDRATNRLNGLTVRFTWDAEAEEHRPSCEEAEEDWLGRLVFDREFAALLPSGEVEVGDEWRVPGEDLRDLTRIERNLPLEREHERDGEVVEVREVDVDDKLEEPETVDEDSGELSVRLDGLRVVDERQLAILVLEGELSNRRYMEDSDDNEHGSMFSTYDRRTTSELRGECLWDVTGGHLHSLSLEFEHSADIQGTSVFEGPDRVTERGSVRESEGESTLEVRFERVE